MRDNPPAVRPPGFRGGGRWPTGGCPCPRFESCRACTSPWRCSSARSPAASACRRRRSATTSAAPKSPASAGRSPNPSTTRRWSAGCSPRRRRAPHRVRCRPGARSTRALRRKGVTLSLLWPEYKGQAQACDNLRSEVRRAHRYEPDLNPTYHDLAHHYGVVVLPAPPQDPGPYSTTGGSPRSAPSTGTTCSKSSRTGTVSARPS